MSEQELKRYQQKLLKIRDVYQHTNVFSLTLISNESNIFEFHADHEPLPPKYNIFGRFTYSCTKHEPPHTGWYLLWNPNSSVSNERLLSPMNNYCAPFEFQNVCKKIQAELEQEFPSHFKLVDVYDYEFPADFHNRVKYIMDYKCPLICPLVVGTRLLQEQRLTDSTLTLVPSNASSKSSSSNDMTLSRSKS